MVIPWAHPVLSVLLAGILAGMLVGPTQPARAEGAAPRIRVSVIWPDGLRARLAERLTQRGILATADAGEPLRLGVDLSDAGVVTVQLLDSRRSEKEQLLVERSGICDACSLESLLVRAADIVQKAVNERRKRLASAVADERWQVVTVRWPLEVQQRLAQGMDAVPGPACAAAACFEAAAMERSGPLLALQVTEDGFIAARLYDARKRSAGWPFEQAQPCSGCSVARIENRLRTTADDLVLTWRKAPWDVPVSYRRPARFRLGIALGVLGAVALVPAGVLWAWREDQDLRQGWPAPGFSCDVMGACGDPLPVAIALTAGASVVLMSGIGLAIRYRRPEPIEKRRSDALQVHAGPFGTRTALWLPGGAL